MSGDAVCLRDDKRTGKIGATMSGRVRAHSQQKPSSVAMSRMKVEGLKPESERDSGFSDASSEHLSALDQMDLDETAQGMYPGAQTSQLVMGAPYSGLSPMIFMNNALLKQPNDTPQSPNAWGFQPAIEMLPQPQVVFLQPMVSANPSLQRSVSMKRRRSKKYFPILKSYPKIAPHPGDSSSEQGSSGSTERSSSASSHWGRRRAQKQKSCPAGVILLTPPALPVTSGLRAPSPKQCPSLQEPSADSSGVLGNKQPGPLSDNAERAPSTSPAKPSSPHAEAGALAPFSWPVEQADGPPTDDDCDSKRKRFCNTYNILSQSGLLDITLRIKELIRQNRHSQGQLERLQTQAGLFREAVQSGSPEVWTRLQKAMQEAGPEAMEEEIKHAPERLP
ncbi:CLOCK-interacting pacemaker-like isoform X2 [Anguilla rostrata]|uniref:CLOCK-interacting pacemaker-like isoform X2 n=1 Tax=Anguilla rostrata TaxID=7938 RepID=UPI0030CAB23B